MQTEEPADDELLRRHVEGDHDAFVELFHRHRQRMWALALRTLGNPTDAEDAVQEAVLSAYRRAAGFRGEAAVGSWLHRIVVNNCMDILRRRAARPEEAWPAVEPADPSDPLAEAETAVEVTRALAELPVEQRVALLLVDMTGHPVAEAARILDVPAGTVKSRCARGRARLAVLLAGQQGNPPAAAPVKQLGTEDEEVDGRR